MKRCMILSLLMVLPGITVTAQVAVDEDSPTGTRARQA